MKSHLFSFFFPLPIMAFFKENRKLRGLSDYIVHEIVGTWNSQLQKSLFSGRSMVSRNWLKEVSVL